MAFIIGLTGKACTGKNVVATALTEKNFYVIDVDKLGHQALRENKDLIVKTFGEVLTDEGIVDRRKLGDIVFSSKTKLRELEAITHPGIKKIIINLIKEEKKGKNRDVVINAAILERGNLLELCDKVIYVKSNLFQRYKRTKKRDNRGFFWFLKRTIAQKDIKKPLNWSKKNLFTFNNNNGIDNIYRQVNNFYVILYKKEH
ncbi:MAG: dephospho-CoA kinase [Spirochaetaceae bacterium]|nr:dephospho-CoA kinase [Spirochaetaceae bacterium]